MQAYCVKCRAKREMKDARAITMKSKKLADDKMLDRLQPTDDAVREVSIVR